MKAAQINEYGGKEVLRTVEDAPKPVPNPGQVLVEVHAAAVNPFDYKVREGYMKEMIPLSFPATLGGDLAGVVAELGEGVETVNVGDEVFGQANAAGGQGSYAEFTLVKAESVSPKPKTTDFITAAALPLAGVSAIQALIDHMNLQSGQKILIHGGAGGIGSFAIQVAKYLGAYVATTAGPADSTYVKNLGADEVIDYTSQAFEDVLENLDAVFDTVGGETAIKSYQVVKPGGTLVSTVAPPDEALMEQYGVKAIIQSTKVNRERLTKLAELVDQGAIKVNVDKVFPLDEAAEALAYIQDGNHKGKVVLRVR